LRANLLIALAALAAACSPSDAATTQKLSPTAFRDAVEREISQQRSGLCFEKPDDFTLRIGRPAVGCNEVVLNTTYQYRQYEAGPAHDPARISGLAATALDAVASLDQKIAPARERLVVLVRPDAYAAYLRQSPESPGGIWKPFVGDLIAVLAQKDGDTSRSVTGEDLAALGLTENAAWALAIENLGQQIGPLDRAQNAQGAESVTASSGLALSNLLLPDTCRQGTDFYAFAVERETFFYAETAKPEASSMLASYAAELLQKNSETYSDNLLSCIDGRWHALGFNAGKKSWVPKE